eukprot:CAMPEP_0185015664 /NCGR_PEP_ID=MMETSP1098-20130426/99950_1 /TAXON_ID=89044 /ORGANISM="Spumella elongata, Strain CCAP 955/1" /LENGTH=91 /DNA_ID=CAMNT_0027544797 /DNA_START=804 /DNA_END=1079 /DNA_ORIENTATION=-
MPPLAGATPPASHTSISALPSQRRGAAAAVQHPISHSMSSQQASALSAGASYMSVFGHPQGQPLQQTTTPLVAPPASGASSSRPSTEITSR